ncbi:MAG TPA: acyl-CoA dehydrogenase [Mycobacteriales bacterium]|nr:acyl-CoA dehydrogenase [Mycobacteriales bacterium]
MALAPTSEQQQLRDSVRRLLERKSTSEDVRALIDGGSQGDERLWRQMSSELGLQGIAIPEHLGGTGAGVAELSIVLEEMGRTLLVGPYFSSIALAGQALVASSDADAQQRWLPRIADGSMTATLAVAEESDRWDGRDCATTVSRDGAEMTLTGIKMFVPDGCTSDVTLVITQDASEPTMFAVERSATVPVVELVESLDLTRPMARLTLDHTPATAIDLGGDPAARVQRIFDLAVIAVAAEQLGGAAKCLEMAVEYARTREQFGRPIGSFQAIKHKCADLLMEIEAARSALLFAARSADSDSEETSIAASTAKVWCSRAFTRAAKENIQIHGGIGYTWEHDAHLYLRRAKTSEMLFGSPAFHRRRVAQLAGIEPRP